MTIGRPPMTAPSGVAGAPGALLRHCLGSRLDTVRYYRLAVLFPVIAEEVPILCKSQIVQVQITRSRPVAQVVEAVLLSCNSATRVTISRIHMLKPLHIGASPGLKFSYFDQERA